MKPDFNKKTIDTLAKRAAYKCSNPDCRVNTVGPNSDPAKSIVLGEAAHVYGARPGSKRFDPTMTDNSRAEITNGIWLCRNCHKKIDADENRYDVNVLFTWREHHEIFVLEELGNSTDKIKLESQIENIELFKGYPPLIKRIVLDKPDGWEWRLTAELMRYLNAPVFRKIEDLRGGLYVKQQRYVRDDDLIPWVQERLAEASNMMKPFEGLLARLSDSWGDVGEVGDEIEIHHICCLIRDHLERIVEYEERVCFANVASENEKLVNYLKDYVASQAEKVGDIPNDLDEIILLVSSDDFEKNKDHKITKTIVFELPKNWEKNFGRELKKATKRLNYEDDESVDTSGCVSSFIWLFIIICGIYIYF